MAKGVEIRLYNVTTEQRSLSNLICLWWDQTDVYEFNTPIGRTDSATTDADGDLTLDISNVSGLSIGDYGYLLVRKEDGSDHRDSLVFQGRVQVSDITGGTQLVYSEVAVEEYVRPADWISLGTLPTETDNKFLGLHAVFKDGPNWCAFKFTCSDSSQYTVDWGDGTSTENIDSGTTAYHSFDYNNLAGNTETGISEARSVTFQDTGDTVTLLNHGFDNGTEISFSSIVTTTGISTYTRYYVVNISGSTFQVSDTKGGTAKIFTNDGTGAVYLPGYRQSLVTVTPTTTGKVFTALDLNIRHTSASAVAYSTGWLDICLAAPSMTSLTIGASANNVNQRILEKFNTISNGAITDFSYMFVYCYSLQSISLLDTSGGTNFSYMFSGCFSLQFIPLLDTSNGTNFSYMFQRCYSLKSIPLLDTSSGTNFSNMFDGCRALKSVPLLDTSSGTNFSLIFYGCSSLQSIPLLNTSNGTDFSDMFDSCYALKSVPLLNTSSGTNFIWMFVNCYSLQSIPLLDTSSGTDFQGMLNNCFYLQSIPLLDISNGLSFDSMFSNCYFLQSIPLLDTSSGTEFYGMFSECYSLKSVPLLDTSSGTGFSYMFNACYTLKSVPLLDTSSGTNFQGIFSSCRALKSVPLLDTSSGTDFNYMFQNCYSLESVPLLSVSLQSGTFYGAFSDCYSLQKGALQGTAQSITYSAGQLSPTNLDEIFSYLASNVTTKTITVTNNWGAAKVSLSGTTTSGSTTVTMASTAGLSANMWITGTNISSSRSVTFQDTGDTVTLNNHGISNGTRVSFTAITTTTGLTLKTIYYVVNTQTNTFQVSDTVGGAAKTLTTDGSGTLIYENYIVSIVPNTSITISIPASGSATNTLTSTTMNPYLATLKGWTVTN